MRFKLAAVAVALAGIGLAGAGSGVAQDAKAKPAPKSVAAKKPATTPAKAPANCVRKYGRGEAWTLDGAKFQAWEIITQVTGNWPIVTDDLRNEKYNCKPGGLGFVCHSQIDVCKKG